MFRQPPTGTTLGNFALHLPGQIKLETMSYHYSHSHILIQVLHHLSLLAPIDDSGQEVWIPAYFLVLMLIWETEYSRKFSGVHNHFKQSPMKKRRILDLYPTFLSCKETQRGLQTPFPSSPHNRQRGRWG
uniref:Uncharacterized protein n=1 Tax=Sphaerodactylus townsendi TaxID=933632 RepID=A0ACB8EDM9_9SAUR